MCLSCKHVDVCEVFVMCGGFFMFCFVFLLFLIPHLVDIILANRVIRNTLNSRD